MVGSVVVVVGSAVVVVGSAVVVVGSAVVVVVPECRQKILSSVINVWSLL